MIEVPDWYKGDVSRETIEQFGAFHELLRIWTQRINLISKNSIDSIPIRHIWDSAQIYRESEGLWLDLGSGGGLPGIVVAILRQSHESADETVLVESDQRKCTFLRTCVRELDLNVRIINARVEAADVQNASMVSARALTSLDGLLGYAKRHLTDGGTCVFLKGATWKKEIDAAEINWRFSYEATPSKTNAEAAILTIKDIERV